MQSNIIKQPFKTKIFKQNKILRKIQFFNTLEKMMSPYYYFIRGHGKLSKLNILTTFETVWAVGKLVQTPEMHYSN